MIKQTNLVTDRRPEFTALIKRPEFSSLGCNIDRNSQWMIQKTPGCAGLGYGRVVFRLTLEAIYVLKNGMIALDSGVE